MPAFVAELKSRGASVAIVALATVFLRYYPIEKKYFEALRKAIVELLPHARGPKARGLVERSARYGLFELGGTEKFGEMLWSAPEPLQLIRQVGLEGVLAERGFVECSVANMLGRIKNKLSDKFDKTQRLVRWLAFFESEAQQNKLRHPGLRVKIAEALLLPFADQNPKTAIGESIREFLIKHFQDPRIRLNSWQGVDERALVVIRRWLVDSTLEDFFAVVRQGSEIDEDADRMWPYREAFWRAYLNKGAISEAWVVLGDAIVRRGRKFLEGQSGAYGKLQTGANTKPSHAVLILRIEELVISEWSHTGKWRLWHDDNPNAPKLYKSGSRYSRKELVTSADYEGAHHGAKWGGWQQQLADKITEWTGVKVMQKEYMPDE